MDDSVKGMVSFGMGDILVLGFIVEEFIELLVRGNVYVDMARSSRQGLLEEGIVVFIV